jgi:predicted metalloprotease with PDZ domain
VDVRKLQASEYLAAADYASWTYSVDLTPPKDRNGLAHASWIGESEGILMLDDLVPRYETRTGMLPANIILKLPPGWSSVSSNGGADGLAVDDASKLVIFIGKAIPNLDLRPKSGELHLLMSGEWQFTPDEAAAMAIEIFDEYSQMLGRLPNKPYQIAIKRFLGRVPHGQWEAETRGRTVTIMSSDMPFRTQSLQRLHEQLRHEIFHLWFPNGIDLIGDYAWFYEGFAMYASLKLAVKLNRIRFNDFLDTLSRAHTIDTNSRPRRPLTDPGIDPTVRYARGMIVAFLTDIDLLRNSNGKSDVGKSLRSLFVDRPRLPHGEVSNEAIKAVVSAPLIQRYVDGAEVVDWTADLATAGIESVQTGRATALKVAAKPNGRQKAILDRLGYNNWRKTGNRK